LAEKATPGPWFYIASENSPMGEGWHPALVEYDEDLPLCENVSDPDAAYIAAASPDSVLALLDRLEKAEVLLRETLGNLGHDLNCKKRLPGQECTCYVDDLEARVAAALTSPQADKETQR
jgi:hypothetical protein